MTNYSDDTPMMEVDEDITDKGAAISKAIIDIIGSISADDIIDGRAICIGMGGALGAFLNGLSLEFRTKFIKRFFETTIAFAEVPLIIMVKQ